MITKVLLETDPVTAGKIIAQYGAAVHSTGAGAPSGAAASTVPPPPPYAGPASPVPVPVATNAPPPPPIPVATAPVPLAPPMAPPPPAAPPPAAPAAARGPIPEGWTEDHIKDMAKKYSAKFGPAAMGQLAKDFGATRATLVDPPEWPRFYHQMQNAITTAG